MHLVLFVVLIAALAGCTAKTLPTTSPTSAAPPTIATVSSPLPPATTPEDAAWAKVEQAARNEKSVTIYGSIGFAGSKGRTTLEAFKNRYGIRVDMLNLAGRQIVEKVGVEARVKQPIADLAAVGTSSATELYQSRLIARVWPDLPSFRDKGIFRVSPFHTSEGEVLIMVMNTLGTMINTKLVKPEDEPRSYFDLLDPKWKKKILLSDPRGGGGGGFMFFAHLRYYKVLDDDYYRRFVAQEPILWGGATPEEYNMMARGEALVDPVTSSSGVAYLIMEGAPLKILGMKEGNLTQGDSISMVKEPPHPNAARLFMNWIFSQEGQTVYAKAGSFQSIRKDVPDFTDPKVRVQPEPQKLLPADWTVSEATNQYQKEGVIENILGKK